MVVSVRVLIAVDRARQTVSAASGGGVGVSGGDGEFALPLCAAADGIGCITVRGS